MYDFLEFLRKYHYVLLFLVLEALSFVLLVRFNHYQGSVWLTGANSAAVGVNRLYSDAVAYLNLGEANRRLCDENLRLQLESQALREALHQMDRDSLRPDSATLAAMPEYHQMPASVVSISRRGSGSYLVVDRGEEDGVRPEMGVVGGLGVVGIVYLTGPHYSLVLPVNNRRSSISCRVRGKRYFGYLQWDGRSSRTAYVDDIPRYAKIRVGEVVETSGYSSVFPPGIHVGRVRHISNSADGQSYRLDVDLGEDFATLRDVNIIDTPYKAEIDTLQARAARAEAGMSE